MTRRIMHKTPITVAYGDGIGPEIMQATLRILEAAGAAVKDVLNDIRRKTAQHA
jgi:isocitrate dehydrogenase